MPRPRKSIPSYRLYKPSGNAYSDFTDPLTGRHRSVCLGRWDSPESRAEHARLCAEVAVGQPAPVGGLSVAELLLTFLRHAEQAGEEEQELRSAVQRLAGRWPTDGSPLSSAASDGR